MQSETRAGMAAILPREETIHPRDAEAAEARERRIEDGGTRIED
jgi:hypothetical protein